MHTNKKQTTQMPTFGTPNGLLNIQNKPQFEEKADGVTSFELSYEDQLYVHTIDAQSFAAKETLSSIIKLAQDNFAKSTTQLCIMREDFIQRLTKKYNLPSTAKCMIDSSTGLFRVKPATDGVLGKGMEILNNSKHINEIIDKAKDSLNTMSMADKSIEDIMNILQSGEGSKEYTAVTNMVKKIDTSTSNFTDSCDIHSPEEIKSLVYHIFCREPLAVDVELKLKNRAADNIVKGMNDYLENVLEDEVIMDVKQALATHDESKMHALVAAITYVDANDSDKLKRVSLRIMAEMLDNILDLYFKTNKQI